MRFAILIYDQVEPIDLGATFGVFSMAKRIAPDIETCALANSLQTITCANGLRITPDESFKTFSGADVVIVTGGPGWVSVAEDNSTLSFLKALPKQTQLVSICTGAMILAAAGVLDGIEATTKSEVYGMEEPPLEILRTKYENVSVKQAVAIMSGNRLTSGGVSLGIDGIFYLLAHTHGASVAKETARIMEYDRSLKANAAYAPARGFNDKILEILE